MNLHKIIHRKTLSYTLIVYFLFHFVKICYAEEEEKVYRPYPVIFVHGFNSSRSGAWKDTINALTPYYTKYDFQSEQWYFPYMDYGFDNHGYCERIASRLHTVVNSALISMAYMNPPVPSSKRKVIIVCHSFGGLVTKYMLNSINQSKVYKTVFIGTPHIGSPLASTGWLIYDNTKKNSRLRKDKELYTAIAKNVNGGLSSREIELYNDLVNQINAVIKWDEDFIRKVNNWTGIELDRPCIMQMRVPASISCETELEAGGILFNLPYNSVNSYAGGRTFLATTALTKPNNKRTLWGTGGFVGWAIQKIVNIIISDCPHIFGGFPYGHSLGDLSGGDGIVTYKSQTELGKEYRLNFANHISETNKWQTILQAIDDEPPEVTKIYAVPKYWLPENKEESEQYYIIVGCKEYLLADVEVRELTLDGKDINPFPEDKPYNTFGKDFLREREVANIANSIGKPIKLKPGEFYVLANIPSGLHTLKVRLRNPAQKIKGEKGAKPIVVQFSRPKVENVSFVCSSGHIMTLDVPPYDDNNDSVEEKIGNEGWITSFSIGSPLFQDVLVDVKIRGWRSGSSAEPAGPSGGLFRTFVKNRSISLSKVSSTSKGKIYFDNFPSNQIKKGELHWAGEADSGGFMTAGGAIHIWVRSKDRSGMGPPFNINNSSGRQGLYGSNWDDSEGTENDYIIADPTFVQYNRQAKIPIGLDMRLELLGVKCNFETNNSDMESIKNNSEAYLETNLIPLLEAIIRVEEQNLANREILMKLVGRYKFNSNIAKWILVLTNCRSKMAVYQAKEKIENLFRNINNDIKGLFINKVYFTLKYKSSHSSKSIKINIQEEIS